MARAVLWSHHADTGTLQLFGDAPSVGTILAGFGVPLS